MTRRKQTFQNVSWFLDLKNREMLNMDPPFQRRSVWNHAYREAFVDTILLGYPSPAIFLFRRVEETGVTRYDVVDGKQRLTTIFDFLDGQFPVGESSPLTNHRGKYFESLDHDTKIHFFDYDFSVEYLPTNDDTLINDIFDRLNRNVSKLTRQELRHAQFSGEFIRVAENLSDWLERQFSQQMPRVTSQSKRQMKDVEIVGTLLLFLEEGVRGYSADLLDKAFSDRDEEWERKSDIEEEFRGVIGAISDMVQHRDGQFLLQSRLRNQADFYSLFGAVALLLREKVLPIPDVTVPRLRGFLEMIDDIDGDVTPREVVNYYEAARSASNDAGARNTRIRMMKRVLTGDNLDGDDT